jgi:HPt (histidine-containing phosphotransfer) domain-containing protein
MHIINYPKLEEMFYGKTAKVELLISALRKRIPEWLAEAQEAFESKDGEAIRKVCHRIRGAAGTITAEKLEDAATKWGEIIKENRIEEISSGHENLVKAIKELEMFTLNK